MFGKKKMMQSDDNEENYRTLMNHCHKWSKNGIKCIAMTGFVENQGRTMLVYELGKRLAEAEYKTLIVDCDVTRPSLSKKMKEMYSGGPQRLETMIYDININEILKYILDYIQPTDIRNLYFCSRGGSLDKPQEKYISKERISILFEAFKEKFDIILLDVCSLKHLSYAQVFLESADGYLLLVKSDTIPLRDMKLMRRKLKKIDSNILGAVFKEKILD